MPTSILRIDASSRSSGSFSRDIGDVVERSLLAKHPGADITRRDLAQQQIEHIRNETIIGYYTPGEAMTDELKAVTLTSDEIIAEAKSADILLITTPMYNFSIPSALKAWIDQLVRIGRTFDYDGHSFTGLLPGKQAYVVIAYGAGGYSDDGPLAGADFAKPYLSFLLGFLGIQDVTFVPVEATTADQATVACEVEKARQNVRSSLDAG
ncbi:FMN-dependent NADH-azoreductase [Thiobacillus sp.]